MKATEICNILVSYLQSQGVEMRIYKEKSIGASICDVMAATDFLAGYEIKSDSDDLRRFETQKQAYDRFFDRNHIVVGASHLGLALERVPEYWGIICIEEDGVRIEREARENKTVSRRAQLSVLWKIELKNILIKNEMPLFAQRDKGYIADRIAAEVEDSLLQKQIAYELLHRDYSVFKGATDYSVYTEGFFSPDLPAREIVDMLSENDLNTFTLDKWIDLYKKARELRENKETLFVKKLKEPLVRHEIPYTNIAVSLGAPWIGVNIINDFIGHIMYDRETPSRLCKYEPVTGNWFIDDKRAYYIRENKNLTVKYGTDRYNALYILEAALNLREIKLCDRYGRYDEYETVAALDKKKILEREFADWIWLDEDRRFEVEDAYNKLFAAYRKKTYDGSALKFENMSESFELYPYQKDAVQMILESKNTLLAFDVGAGKTFIMIAAAMKMRKDGTSRRNMFVVPNHIVGQWEKIFTELYPKAKVLAIEPKTFKPEMRQKVLRQIKEGDYDGVIIAYSCFEMIPISENIILDNMNAQLQVIENAIRDLCTSSNYDRWNKTVLDNEKERIKKMMLDIIDSMAHTGKGEVTFDDLEISTLFLDEAHNYKNLPFKTQLRGLNGINTKGSSKCLDMLHKVRCVQNAGYGRGAVFATGTPLCNSISDAYTMQMYLQFEEMQKTHLDQFDNWVKTFAKPEQLMEIDVDTSKYRMIRKLSRFHNLPELSRMFSQIAIFYAIEDDGALPQFEGYTDVVIEKNEALSEYMKTLCERTDLIRQGMIDRKYDNMLKVSTDGRKAALDLTLVGAEQPYNKSSKIRNCVENVTEIYQKHAGCTQLIFCDYSTPKGEDFSVYKKLKSRLVEKGIPEKEIAFIHSYNTESRKVELFRRFNAGEVRVLIGSTFKLGIGANVQVKLKAIHHLDVPWRPADMIQREGRIVRRGNENESVLIYRYITEGSFDSYSWQILESKQRFISQFLAGSAYQRSVTDLEDNVLTYAEVKALAISEPLMKQIAETENEIKSLRIVVEKEKETIEKLKDERKRCSNRDRLLEERITISHYTHSLLLQTSKEEHKEAAAKMEKALTSEFITGKSDRTFFDFLCFKVSPDCTDGQKKPHVFLRCNGVEYRVEMGESPKGNARRLLNFVNSFGSMIEKFEQTRSENLLRIGEIDDTLRDPKSANRSLLMEKEAELERLKGLVTVNPGSEPDWYKKWD